MNAADFDAVCYDGAAYCLSCYDGDVNDPECSPIFADSEWDSYPVCDACGEAIDYVCLTTYGRVHARVRELAEQYTDGDEDAAAFGYAAWCVDHHGGQFTDEYAAPTVLGIRFGAGFHGRASLEGTEASVYDALCDDEGCDHSEDERSE